MWQAPTGRAGCPSAALIKLAIVSEHQAESPTAVQIKGWTIGERGRSLDAGVAWASSGRVADRRRLHGIHAPACRAGRSEAESGAGSGQVGAEAKMDPVIPLRPEKMPFSRAREAMGKLTGLGKSGKSQGDYRA